MSSCRSFAVCESIYKKDPEYFSRFAPRIHEESTIADRASIQCQIDLYGDDVGRRFGNINTHSGNFTALTAPESLPDRLALIAYTFEYAFLHDDDTDNASDPQTLLKENTALLQALNPRGNDFSITGLSELSRRKSEVRAKIAAEFLRIDPVFGRWFLSYWKKFTESMHDVRSLHFPNLDDYLAFRVVDAAAIWTLSLIRWAAGLYLSPEEERTAGPITFLAYAALALTNDLFSYDKECISYLESNRKVPFVNAVFVVMQTLSISEEEAKEVVKSEIRTHEEQFQKKREEYISSPNASPSITDWFKILEYSISGNFVWSLRTPRYWKNVGNPYRELYEKAADPSSFKVIQPPVSGVTNSKEALKCHLIEVRSKIDGLAKSKLKVTLTDTVLLEPYNYLLSLPSKNVRRMLLGAINVWYRVSDKSLLTIEGIINYLHHASLILDDIQDGTSLRRGKPAAHKVYGVSQAINSATFLMNEALQLAQSLSPDAIPIYSDELRNLHIGQGHDLHWTYHIKIPTEEQYLAMVDGKTGGLFRLISRLMRAEATVNAGLDLQDFMTLFGRLFQIRDDYQNLTSADYSNNKGIYEDLDEGKFSFPLIQALNNPIQRNDTMLENILRSRQKEHGLCIEMKEYALEQINSRNGLGETEKLLKLLHTELLYQLSELEIRAGNMENWSLRHIITNLSVDDTQHDPRVKVSKDTSGNVWKMNQKRAWSGESREIRPVNRWGLERAS